MPNYKSLHGYIAKLLNRKRYNNSTIQQFNNIKEGFSLIELILSLFSISILALILVTSIQSLSTRRRQDLSAIASKAATKEIEHLRNLNFSSITATTSPLACSSEFTQAGTSSYLPGCSIRRDVDSYQGDSLIKQVGLTVSWTTTGSQTKSVTMQTL